MYSLSLKTIVETTHQGVDSNSPHIDQWNKGGYHL